jgi:uncharacterized protein
MGGVVIVAGDETGEGAALAEERRRLRLLKTMVDLTTHTLAQAGLTRAEGEALVAATRSRVLELFPDKAETFDLILAPRFARLLDAYTRGARVLPFRSPRAGLLAALGLALQATLALGATPGPASSLAATSRALALGELRGRVTAPERLQHAVAVEAIMVELARVSGAAPEEWALAGLLHDIDLAATQATPSRHGPVGARLLETLGFSPAVVRAVERHDDAVGLPRTTPIEHALSCADRAYWVVHASGLRLPSAEAAGATPASVLAGLEQRGATGRIDAGLTQECATLGLSVDDLLRLCLRAVAALPEVAR